MRKQLAVVGFALVVSSFSVACGGFTGGDSETPVNGSADLTSAADLGTVVGTQTSNNGHHEFQLFEKSGPQVGTEGPFSHDATFSLSYVDDPGPDGFFKAAAEIEAFIQVDTVKVHHGGQGPSDPQSTQMTIELKNNGNSTYIGSRPPITLTGDVADNDTVVTKVSVAFSLFGGRIAEQAFGQNYVFVLDTPH